MTNKLLSILIILSVSVALGPRTAQGYTLQYLDNSGILARRWLISPILISFSSSLADPPPNIKHDSDVIATVRRALRHWEDACKVRFVEVTTSVQTVSPPHLGDGVNLITVSVDNEPLFRSSENPAMTRVFFDASGAITEADIALNPHQDFSTDGSPGTYDLESTLTHEIGHLIGLDHSGVIAATMQPRQAKNGTYGLPAFTQRTLSDDDKAAARSLYGPRSGSAGISGRLLTNNNGRAQTIFGAHVFAEDATGRVAAGSVTLANGEYRLDGLPSGEYRLIAQSLNGPVAAREISSSGSYATLAETTPAFRSFVGTGQNSSEITILRPNATVDSPFFVLSNPPPSLKPELIGMNDELSTAPLPLQPGKTFTIYVAGVGVDELRADGIFISSPLITVNARSFREEFFEVLYPVISFEITVSPDISRGDYSIHLVSPSGEQAYLAGAITIDSAQNGK